ncbi:MAG: sialidase family protein [Rikenellaceae bacterium]|nr:sialidase family protein [Rikenellaceae bacterium]
MFGKIVFSSVLSLLCLWGLTVKTAAQTSENIVSDTIIKSLVFNPGDYGSKFYRIPAIVTTEDGNLLAVADKRIESMADLPGKIDVVARISEDGGCTWGPYTTVIENDGIGGYGDPALVVDRRNGDVLMICTHGNGLWQDAPGYITVVRSRDGGRSWGDPLFINDHVFCAESDGRQPIKNVKAAFASSGGAVQLDNGRIMFALVVREKDKRGFLNYAVYSDDGGYTWSASGNPAHTNGDEAKIAQLADGSLVMSIRSRSKGGLRQFSYSDDLGETWSAQVGVTDIIDPACNGDLIRYTHGGHDFLLQSIPAAMTNNPVSFENDADGTIDERADIAVFISRDRGASWPSHYQLMYGSAAYSAMTVMPDGDLGVLIEEEFENAGQGYCIRFYRVPTEVLLGCEKTGCKGE